MRTILLLFTLLLVISSPAIRAQQGRETSGGLMRRSIDRNPLDGDPESTPGGPVAKAPLATGYYVVDNDGAAVGPRWTPTYTFIDTTGVDAGRWHRIRSGPNQVPMSTWALPGSQGKEFFQNPSVPRDSTDNAIAGPIAIGFSFYYYGRAYDSFYVSTNGLVALTNRRYQYDETGNRTDYNPFRDDTLARPRQGTHVQDDPTPDDYGWSHVALGNTSSPLGGIRSPYNRELPDTAQRSIIAPLWCDQELSQFDTTSGRVDDLGRVYWRRDDAGDRLIIYFVDLTMKGSVRVPLFNLTVTAPKRMLRASLQVTLDRTDSSVQVNYVRFLGGYYEPVLSGPWITTSQLHRANSTIGIQSNGDVPAPCSGAGCAGATGIEYTNYLALADPARGGRIVVSDDPIATPHAGLAIRFHQWSNRVRVLGVDFQIPSRSVAGAFDGLAQGDRPENYELLLGHPLLGVIRPMGIIQNVSDSIGPVNRTPQPIAFDVLFRIRDAVNCTSLPLYQRTQSTASLHPIRVAAPDAPSIDTVVFDPYVTNAQLARQAGRFRAEVIAVDRSSGELWPFDDTTGVRMFVVARRQIPFITTFDDFSFSCDDGALPNTQNWVSIGADVVDGDQNTWSPPPPRNVATGSNGTTRIASPVLRMDRAALDGVRYAPAASYLGDTLVSFPIDISAAARPVVILSYERSGKTSYDRGWSDRVRTGPEHAAYDVRKTAFLQMPDRLVVEFAEPSPNGLDNITNVRSWSEAGFGDTTSALTWRAITGRTTAPRWGVFGGGGGSGSDTSGGIVVDVLDAGKDVAFHRACIPIPARWSRDANANRSFRFRVMVEAADHGDPLVVADDDDPFYIDNIEVTTLERPELEVTAVGARWPYTIAPASQARAIPLFVTVANNGAAASTSFGVAISVRNLGSPPPAGRFNYYRFRSIISLGAGKDRTELFPTWNAQECGSVSTGALPNELRTTVYRITAQILPAGIDARAENDVTHSDFTLSLGPVFAYDDTSRTAGRNEVPGFTGMLGRGLNLAPPAEDPLALEPYGPIGGSSSGSFAARFTVVARDTLRGYQAYFASANQAADPILYSLYRDNAGRPDTVVRATRVRARRGEGVPVAPPQTPQPFSFDTYVTYLLPTPCVVEPGDYYVTISQLGPSGIELGGSARHQGQVTTVLDTASTPLGMRNFSVPAHPEMLEERFWFETVAESAWWSPMLEPTTNPGFPHLRFDGLVGTSVRTFSRGSWIPMIRPYFGQKESRTCLVEPVELASFDVTPLATALKLDWSTASELDNRGFHVERRAERRSVGTDRWTSIAFIEGAGTSNREQHYAYLDADVETATTYQYRLRQEDLDGSATYSAIREGRLAAGATVTLASSLEQNVPNPFNAATNIGYAIAGGGSATIEIIDMYGRNVRSFAVAGTGVITWDGSAADGTPLASGVYIYRLAGAGSSVSRTLSIAR